ncbi:hypothetical protein F511_24346 [Dorcoceras hygrometricum]|uniref:Uncharacterized protein n=1 Tax=Dorcoceras hygrometricum TaxID=472368 RepID=A0A2Z7DDK9_9LAMI|nr:hypothetical protein F511_24346 [Dorcoceras hygrometricum]
MSSWTKSSVSLGKLHETQKPLNDKSGLGFNVGESSSGETSTQSDLADGKFKKMNFFKANVTHDTCESVKYNDHISPKLNYKGKASIGYTRPENNKPSWLKNILDKDKAKARSKSSVPNHDQRRRGSTKAKSVWPALEGLTRSARIETPRNGDRNKSDQRIQLAVGPQPLWLRNHNFGLAQRIMVKRLATSPHDPLGIIDSACKNQLVVVSIQYGPFNPYIPIRSTTNGKSRVVKDPIAMHTSWRSNSDIASVTRVSMTSRVVRTNQYNQDLGLIHSTNGNHLESPNEGSSIDHRVTIYLHAQNITMFPINETWYFASQILRLPDVASGSSSSTSASDSPMRFTTDDTPLGDATTAITLPTDLTAEFAQLRASVDHISLEHVQTRVHIEKLKDALFTKISSLETSFLARSDNIDRAVLVHTEVLHKEMQAQKAALSQELDVNRKEDQDQKAALSNDLMEFLCASTGKITIPSPLSCLNLLTTLIGVVMPKGGNE